MPINGRRRGVFDQVCGHCWHHCLSGTAYIDTDMRMRMLSHATVDRQHTLCTVCRRVTWLCSRHRVVVHVGQYIDVGANVNLDVCQQAHGNQSTACQDSQQEPWQPVIAALL